MEINYAPIINIIFNKNKIFNLFVLWSKNDKIVTDVYLKSLRIKQGSISKTFGLVRKIKKKQNLVMQ